MSHRYLVLRRVAVVLHNPAFDVNITEDIAVHHSSPELAAVPYRLIELRQMLADENGKFLPGTPAYMVHHMTITPGHAKGDVLGRLEADIRMMFPPVPSSSGFSTKTQAEDTFARDQEDIMRAAKSHKVRLAIVRVRGDDNAISIHDLAMEGGPYTNVLPPKKAPRLGPSTQYRVLRRCAHMLRELSPEDCQLLHDGLYRLESGGVPHSLLERFRPYRMVELREYVRDDSLPPFFAIVHIPVPAWGRDSRDPTAFVHPSFNGDATNLEDALNLYSGARANMAKPTGYKGLTPVSYARVDIQPLVEQLHEFYMPDAPYNNIVKPRPLELLSTPDALPPVADGVTTVARFGYGPTHMKYNRLGQRLDAFLLAQDGDYDIVEIRQYKDRPDMYFTVTIRQLPGGRPGWYISQWHTRQQVNANLSIQIRKWLENKEGHLCMLEVEPAAFPGTEDLTPDTTKV